MKQTKPDFQEILRTLQEHQVDFIVVGGVCAVLHGAPISTFDLDLVHSRTPENVRRILAALEGLGAYYRGRGEQRLQPEASHLSSPGHQLLMTRAGPLDLLGSIGKGRTYDDLMEHCTETKIGGIPGVQLLNLKALIQVKEEAAQEKDKAVLPILRRTLEEKGRR